MYDGKSGWILLAAGVTYITHQDGEEVLLVTREAMTAAVGARHITLREVVVQLEKKALLVYFASISTNITSLLFSGRFQTRRHSLPSGHPLIHSPVPSKRTLALSSPDPTTRGRDLTAYSGLSTVSMTFSTRSLEKKTPA
jgi:hypothetical protein